MTGFVLKSHEAQALAAGKPVVIWRALKKQPDPRYKWCRVNTVGKWHHIEADQPDTVMHTVTAPFPVGVPLFGKETWYESGHSFQTYPEDDDWAGWSPRGYKSLEHIRYAMDGLPPIRGENDWNLTEPHSPKFIPDQGKNYWRKQPSVHMPEWASRITLTLSDVKVRRPCDVTGEEACDMLTEECRAKAPYMETKGVLADWHIRAFRKQFSLHYKTDWNLYHFTALATPQSKDS